MLKAFCQCKCYHCKALNPGEVFIEVRERFENETVFAYLEHVAEECGKDHRTKSPLCATKKLAVAMPMSQNGIGFPGPPLTEEDQKRLREQLKQK